MEQDEKTQRILHCSKRDTMPCYQDASTGKFHFCTQASEPRNLAECLERFEVVQNRYLALARQLDKTTLHFSFVDENWPLLKEIVALGEGVLVFLLREIAENVLGIWWRISAVHSIASYEHIPVPAIPEEEAGFVEKIKDRYLNWGKEHGYI